MTPAAVNLVLCYSVTSSINQMDVSSQAPVPPPLGPVVRDWMSDPGVQADLIAYFMNRDLS